MKLTLILLFVFTSIGCREEKEPQSAAVKVVRKSQPVGSAARSSASLGLPPHLLVTPRVTVSFAGTAVGYGLIESSAQAEVILADICTLPRSPRRDRAIADIIVALARVNPAQASVLLGKWNDGLISTWLEVAENIAKKLGEADPQAGAKFIEESVPRAAQSTVWNRFLAGLPVMERVRFFDRIPESSAKLDIAAALVPVWLRDDPVSCAIWLDDFAAGKSPEELRIYLGNPNHDALSSIKTAPSAWLDAFRAAKGDEARVLFAQGAWRGADGPARAGLIPELQDVIPQEIEEERKKIIETDPAGYAVALSPSQIAALSHDDMTKIIGSWSKAHPQDALQWAVDHGREEAAEALTSLYYLEPKTALALAPKLPPGSDRDQAISSLCSSLVRDVNQQAARAMLPLVSDPKIRERIRKNIDRDWD